MKQFIFGKVRVGLLSKDIIRIEYGKRGKFCDENTFFIPDKNAFDEDVECKTFGNYIIVGDYSLSIPEDARSLSGITLSKNGTTVFRIKKQLNCGELPSPASTPEVFAVYDNPRITVPEGGYKYRGKKKNSGYKIETGVQDVYLLICGKDAKKLRRLYVGLTGANELVRISTLGLWNSKYYEYSELTAKQVITDYEKYNLPLDNMVIDTDWRLASDRGIGYDVNKELFPSPSRFFNFAHSHGVEITFNDHPEPVEGADSVLAPAEVKFRTEKLQSLMKLGLDSWWYDRNWMTKLKSPVEGIAPETWGLYLFSEITRHFYETKAGSGKASRRPVIMGNVNNVENGEYKGIADSASHRYSVQWTGDIASDAAALEAEIANLIRCSDNCVSYVNSDCGGHKGNPDKYMYIRWLQFGAFSPVLRPHCTKSVTRYREPWLYDKETLDIAREYINMRYRLLPVIYKNAFENYETGAPIFGGLGLQYPKDKRALNCTSQYMLGNDILIAPVTGRTHVADEDEVVADVTETEEREVYLPAGKWLDVFGGKTYVGGKTVKLAYKLSEMPLFVRLGALVPIAYEAGNTKEQSWDKLVLDFYPNKDAQDSGYIYEDDGETTAYKLGAFRKCAYTAKYSEARRAFEIVIDSAKGVFDGPRAVDKRNYTLKYHLLGGVSGVDKVTVNGAEVPFRTVRRDADAYPFGTSGAPDGATLTAEFTSPVSEVLKILVYLR